MLLPPELVLALAAHCAPGVEPSTMLAIARAESGLDPVAIGVNGPPAARPRPRSPEEAVTAARTLMGAGRDLDVGLLQINVRNLVSLGLSLEAAFDPCRSLAAGARVLQDGYTRGAERYGPGQAALRIALSYYNTGHPWRGFANGYVARVTDEAARGRKASGQTPPAPPDPADAFGRAGGLRLTARFVITPSGATP